MFIKLTQQVEEKGVSLNNINTECIVRFHMNNKNGSTIHLTDGESIDVVEEPVEIRDLMK